MHQTCSDESGTAASPAEPKLTVKGRRARHRKGRWVMEYTPDEVNCVLRDYDSGMNADAISEKHGVSKSTLYRWITRYESQRDVDHDPGSMRLRIATLEKALIHLSLENAALRAEREGAQPAQEAQHVAS